MKQLKSLPFLLCTTLFLSVVLYGNAQETDYVLVWADEFEGNGPINTTKWHHQTLLPNGDSWYNGEIQHYTNRVENSQVSNGTLKIFAKKETFSDQGVTKEYTSARLNSKFAFTYGKVEVRAKLPTGRGTWPAIWTLGQNIIEPGAFWSDTFGSVIWPACGELDIMEHWGSNQNFIQSAIHTPSSHGNTVNKGGRVIPGVSDEFHLYTMEWTEERMTFSVDGVVHYVYDPAVQNAATWPFDANQYLLLNVAVLPDIDPAFTESAMEIDYVRVYQDATLSVEESLSDSVRLSLKQQNDSLLVSLPETLVGAQMTLYSILGQVVETTMAQSTLETLSLSHLASGSYFLLIEKNGFVVRKRIQK